MAQSTPATQQANTIPDRNPPHSVVAPILQDTLDGKLSSEVAASRATSAALNAHPGDPTSACYALWNTIINRAINSPNDQNQIVDILVHISRLPDALDEHNHPIVLGTAQFPMRVWSDLPMFGWQLRDIFDLDLNRYAHSRYTQEFRENKKVQIINAHRFFAHLLATGEPILMGNDNFALWAMRELENPNIPHETIELKLRIIAVWVEILGARMYWWDKEFPYGPKIGDVGGGGQLWNGQHGFCFDRWKLWRTRLGGISQYKKLDEEIQAIARGVETRMIETEEAAVKPAEW